jgi:hypothetical protein
MKGAQHKSTGSFGSALPFGIQKHPKNSTAFPSEGSLEGTPFSFPCPFRLFAFLFLPSPFQIINFIPSRFREGPHRLFSEAFQYSKNKMLFF